jgi:hypothetical protein
MEFKEYYLEVLQEGRMEILAFDHYTGELMYKDEGHNQIQTWTKNALSFLLAGRPFCTFGNHGETIADVGTTVYAIDHYKDGGFNRASDRIFATTYTHQIPGFAQRRDILGTDYTDEGSIAQGVPLYPFFPTKMRFGTGGLDASQAPKTNISAGATNLINCDPTCPFVEVDHTRETQHVVLTSTNGITNKVTYSVKLPGGTSSYPYNGKILSEAGLYCDAGLTVNGDYSMRTGMLLAYRTFRGIAKDESIDIIINWSWLL